MELNYLAILVATVAQFICGAFWYTFLFGPLWGKMHNFDKLSKDVQQEMMKSMGPIYGVQFLVTLLMSFVLALFMAALPQDWNAYGMAFFFWLGFVLPSQTSSVLFGGTESKWIIKKIAVQSGSSLVCLLVAAFVLQLFK